MSDVVDQISNYAKMYKNLKGLVDNLGAGLLAKLEPKFESSSSVLRYAVVRFYNLLFLQALPSGISRSCTCSLNAFCLYLFVIWKVI